jgi:hypothetical protein
MDYELLVGDENRNKPDFLYMILSEKNSKFTITNLKPNTNYDAAVKLVTIYGTTLDGTFYCRIQTQPGIPSQPVAVNVKDQTGSSIKLAFLPPNKPKGDIVSYIIETTLTDDSYCLDASREVQCLPRYTLVTPDASGKRMKLFEESNIEFSSFLFICLKFRK